MALVPQPGEPVDFSADRRKLYLMIGALVVLLVAMFALKAIEKVKTGSDQVEPDSQEAQLLPPSPEEKPVPEPAEKPKEEPKVYDEKVTDRELFDLVAKAMPLTPEMAKERVNTSLQARDLLKAPITARGQLVYAEGRIAGERHVGGLPENPLGIDSLWYLKLVDRSDPADLRVYSLYLIDRPLGAERGEMVRVYAYFLKPWRHEDRRRGREQVEAVLVGKALDPVDYTTDPWILTTVQDETAHVHQKGLIYLANLVRNMPPQELAAQVDQNIQWEELELASERHRGAFVRIAGTLRRLYPVPISPDPLGLRRLYTGFIMIDYRRAYTFYTVKEPKGIREGQYVALDGAFLQRWLYVTPKGTEKTSPVVVGLELVPVEPKVPSVGPVVMGVMLLTFGVVAVAAVMEFIRVRRAEKSNFRRQIRRVSDRVRRSKESADEPGDK